VRRNHLFKPLSWKIGHPTYAGRPWSVKNIFELKNARRVLVEGNLFEHNWRHDQNGFAILFTVRNQGGAAPCCPVEAVTFRNNIAPKRTHGFAGGTKSWPAPSPLVTGDGRQTLDTFYISPVFAGNVLTGSTPANYSGYPGNFFPATDAEVGFVDLARGNYR